MRLAKVLAHAGVASRRSCEALIVAGRVLVDDSVVTDPALDVGQASVVVVDGRTVSGPERRGDHADGLVDRVDHTARDTHGRPTVLDLIPAAPERLYPVGRLDRDSSGLMLLTNDGELANRLTHPSFQVPKTYLATISGGPVRENALRALREGVELEDGRTAPARARRLRSNQVELTIKEGRNRQVRRMCAAVGHPVLELERTGFGPLRLDGLRPGEHRRVGSREAGLLREL